MYPHGRPKVLLSIPEMDWLQVLSMRLHRLHVPVHLYFGLNGGF